MFRFEEEGRTHTRPSRDMVQQVVSDGVGSCGACSASGDVLEEASGAEAGIGGNSARSTGGQKRHTVHAGGPDVLITWGMHYKW
jgi:hypothetical protein